MAVDRLAKISEGQRACLRMVLQHMSSKDIARALNISPHTVDQRLKLAMRTLGAATRWRPPVSSMRWRMKKDTNRPYTKGRTLPAPEMLSQMPHLLSRDDRS
jgi:IS30 family transposase